MTGTNAIVQTITLEGVEVGVGEPGGMTYTATVD